jgi:hypothetical protein
MVCATYREDHQAYAPYRYSVSFPSDLRFHPMRAAPGRHTAIDEDQELRRLKHTAVDYTSCAEAAGQVAVVGGGGEGYGAVAGRARH